MRLEFINRTRRRLPTPALRSFTRRAIRHLHRMGYHLGPRSALTVAFVGEAEGRRLAAKFLRRRAPANVLAFDYGRVGELVMAPGRIAGEARAAGVSCQRMSERLIAHGLLHLAGVHHEGGGRPARRAALGERALLVRLGLATAFPPERRRGSGRHHA